MSFVPGFNQIFSESIEDSFSHSLKKSQSSTLWIGEAEETPIAAVQIEDMETKALLKVYISDIHLVKLDVEITPETILIAGQPTESSIVEGYFRPSDFESLIPLPYPVEPESCRVEVHSDGLKIELKKHLGVQPRRVRIEALTANFIPKNSDRKPHFEPKLTYENASGFYDHQKYFTHSQ
ncbi:hypothetical protein ACL6C3_08380 [Capilliphycus salinus ALCB114379]|uniref:hypothetical protein n=1 Tax=Capilliphycus salinus TaxID=2768948 RepID=UPI0039A6A5F1